MTKEDVRTHIVIPRDMVAAIDRLAGKRRRSAFITEAVREKLARELQKEALMPGYGRTGRSRLS